MEASGHLRLAADEAGGDEQKLAGQRAARALDGMQAAIRPARDAHRLHGADMAIFTGKDALYGGLEQARIPACAAMASLWP